MEKQIMCTQHPGGQALLTVDAFYPRDQNKAKAFCIECRKRRSEQAKQSWKNREAKLLESAAPAELAAQPTMHKIGGYYIHHNAVLIADTLQDGKIALYTTILEIDGETKHPRNKKLLFTKQHAPDEYRAALAWLSDMSGAPKLDTSDNERAAMELAEEATKRLAAAERENAELKKKLDGVKVLLNGSLKESV